MSLDANPSQTDLELTAEKVPGSAVSLDDSDPFGHWYDRYLTKKNTFLILVIIPSIFCAIYYTLMASSQYVAETRMIVRTIGVSEKFSSSETRDGRSIIGGDSLTQDSYIVANYLESPDLVSLLDERIHLRELFSRSDIDYLSRLSRNATFEELHRYWQSHVDTYVDGPSGIIVFTVRAFTPEDSVLMQEAALAAADEMISRISLDAQKDLVKRAEFEVNASLQQYQGALSDLQAYQNKTGVLDPVSTAKLAIAVISKLTQEKLALEVDLAAAKAANASNSARVRQIERSVQALDNEINLRRNSLAGAENSGEQLSNQLTEFSRLETRQIVTEAIYEANVRNLDTAKSTALRRTTFVSIFSKAQLPEDSKYPERVSSWIIFTLALFTLWVTAALIWLSIEDHRT